MYYLSFFLKLFFAFFIIFQLQKWLVLSMEYSLTTFTLLTFVLQICYRVEFPIKFFIAF